MGAGCTDISGIYLVIMASRRAMNALDPISKTASGKVWKIAKQP